MHHIGGGFFISTASDKMAELVRKVGETGKVKTTMPAEEPMETLLFATEDGGLSADNPHQQKLNLTVIDDSKQPLKAIEGTN